MNAREHRASVGYVRAGTLRQLCDDWAVLVDERYDAAAPALRITVRKTVGNSVLGRNEPKTAEQDGGQKRPVGAHFESLVC